MENQPPVPGSKSTFVTVFAWLMIALNGFGLSVSILQNIIFTFIFRIKEFNTAFSDIGNMPKGFPTFFIKNIRLIIPLMGIFVLFAFISSIGLLKRKEWARKAFLFLLAFGILYIIAAIVFQNIFMRSMFHFPDFPPEFNFISVFFMIFMIIFSLGFIVFYGWLFKKLISDKIKAEFKNPEEAGAVIVPS